MKLNAKQKLFIKAVKEKGRFFTSEEAFEFYIENIMRNDVTCKLNNYRPGRHFDDYQLYELEQKAAQWHRITIGSMVLRGIFSLSHYNNTSELMGEGWVKFVK